MVVHSNVTFLTRFAARRSRSARVAAKAAVRPAASRAQVVCRADMRKQVRNLDGELKLPRQRPRCVQLPF